jgi:predicted Zn-dependent peptidase
MSSQTIEPFTLANGFQVIVEEMSDVQSAAFSLLIPAGAIHEPSGFNGSAAALCDLVTRGAGSRDSRRLATELDNLGVQRHEQVGWNFLTFSGAMLSEKLPNALDLYADIVLRPRLPEEEFDPVISGLSQALLANEDEPQRKLSVELRRRAYPEPWGRPTDGDLRELGRVTPETLKQLWDAGFRPNGTILGIAGRVKTDEVLRQVETLFSEWKPRPEPEIQRGPHVPAIDHIPHSSTQLQIGIAYPAPPYGHPDYYTAWAAASILGGGPSARLFTEVREKRGLCYSVQASTNTLKTEGRTMIYAGTSSERAQETLDVTLAELRRLADGIAPDELQRCQARAKSALIMQQESTGSRASSLARDWFHLGRVTTLDEVRGILEELTVDSVLDVARRYPPDDPTIVTLGPHPLEVPAGFVSKGA